MLKTNRANVVWFCEKYRNYIEVCENPKYQGPGTRNFFWIGTVTRKFRDSRIYRDSRKIREKVGFGKELGTRSRTIIRAILSVISYGLTIFRVSFCTYDKSYIDSVSFLVHVLMFGCICFKWRNKPVVFAYLVWNSWWQCVHYAFVSSFSGKCSHTELLFIFFLCTISSALLPATTTLLSLSLDIGFKDF